MFLLITSLPSIGHDTMGDQSIDPAEPTSEPELDAREGHPTTGGAVRTGRGGTPPLPRVTGDSSGRWPIGSRSLNMRQKLVLVLVHQANRGGHLPSTADLIHRGAHPNTVASLRRRGCIEIHLPAVGTDGFRLTSEGKAVYA